MPEIGPEGSIFGVSLCFARELGRVPVADLVGFGTQY